MTPQLLRQILDYNPMTGEFRWKYRIAQRAPKGGLAGTVDSYGYTVIRYGGKGYKAHRLAWLYSYGKPPRFSIDHIDRVKSNNSIQNLRDVPAAVNELNKVEPNVNGSSGVRCVSWNAQTGKWKASFTRHKVHHFVGHFETIAQASTALWAHPKWSTQ